MDNYEGQFYQNQPPMRKTKARRRRPVWQLIVTDVLLLGISLCVFSLFHHVIPQKGTEGTDIIQKPGQTDTSSGKTSGEADKPGDVGYFGDSFPDKFTSDGSIETTDTSYKSGDVNITVSFHNENDISYYVADVYIRKIDFLRTAFANDTYGKGYADWVSNMAKSNNAVLAVNGDYYGNSSKRGTVIRNGVLYRGNTYNDTCIIYRDGTMATYSESEYDIDKVVENNPWQGWSFGPMLLDKNGNEMDTFNSSVKPKNPRCAIGYMEPGHYCFVLVDGRQDGYSVGMTLTELSSLMKKLGCKAAYNLDGGQSAEMVFKDSTVNRPYNGGRKTSDIVYIG